MSSRTASGTVLDGVPPAALHTVEDTCLICKYMKYLYIYTLYLHLHIHTCKYIYIYKYMKHETIYCN